MIGVLTAVAAWVVAVTVCVPGLIFVVEILASAIRARPAVIAQTRQDTIAVLIPAHDESAGLLDTLRTVMPQLKSGDRCLVVADNCSDDTAAVARAAGAEAIERVDPLRRGKGYALDFGLKYLADAPPAVVVMVDADCRVEANGMTTLAARSVETGRPVQGLYLMRAAKDAPPTARIAEFAWRIKNHARPRGLNRLGLPCQLMGSGMAFPWALLRDVDLASGHIVEDMKLGIDLAERGHAALFCEEVLVTSRFATHEDGARAQRTRWEHGHLGIIANEVPRLIGRAILRGDRMLFALALDLVVPPIAMLSMSMFASVGLSSLAFVLIDVRGPLIVSVTSLAFASIAVGVGWWTFGRSVLPLATLAFAPWYAFCKVPLYVRFLVKRQAEWVRSRRDPS
jgi:cellulose synthase/poly-beta-1,6-N-acetylglucosamine synthase-like glycosyltransferase